MGLFSFFLKAFSGGHAAVRRHPSKIANINAWKVDKKGRGEWLSHDEWVKRKRKR